MAGMFHPSFTGAGFKNFAGRIGRELASNNKTAMAVIGAGTKEVTNKLFSTTAGKMAGAVAAGGALYAGSSALRSFNESSTTGKVGILGAAAVIGVGVANSRQGISRALMAMGEGKPIMAAMKREGGLLGGIGRSRPKGGPNRRLGPERELSPTKMTRNGKRFAKGAAQQNIAEANTMYNNRINSSAAFNKPLIGDSLDSPAFARRTPGVKYNRSQSEIVAGMDEVDNLLLPQNRKGSAFSRARAAGGTGSMGSYGQLNSPAPNGPGVISSPRSSTGYSSSHSPVRVPGGTVPPDTGYNMWSTSHVSQKSIPGFNDYINAKQSRTAALSARDDIDNSILSRASSPGRDMSGTRSRRGRYKSI